MLIYAGEPDNKLIAVAEGTGDNLTKEDTDAGYVDYYMLTIYEQDGDELREVDGGQLLLKKPIRGMSYDDRVEEVLQFCDVHNNYKVLEW